MAKKKDNTKLKEKFLKYYRQLPVQKLAAASIGKDETTIFRWKESDADFANQIDSARANWALSKTKGVKSDEWLLERIIKDHFAPRSPLLDDKGKPIPLLDGLRNNNSTPEAG